MHLTRTSDSKTFGVRDWTLSSDIQSLRWALDCKLAEESEHAALADGDEVTLTVAGVAFTVLVSGNGKSWRQLANGAVGPDLSSTGESENVFEPGSAAAVSLSGEVRGAAVTPDGLFTLEVPYSVVPGIVPGDKISVTFRGVTLTDYYVTGVRIGMSGIVPVVTLTVMADLPDVDYNVLFELWTSKGFSSVFIKHFPGFDTQARDLAATVGTVVHTTDGYSSQYSYQYTEYLIFRGSREAGGRYPALSLYSYNLEYAIDEDFNPTNPRLYVEAGRIKADRDFYGYVKVTYDTTYSMLKYSGAPTGDLFIFTFGTILSKRMKSIASYDVQPIGFRFPLGV
ncbi:MAG TPA: hypothetical protein DIC36_09285, partial [Gammaproteobacteria bacterium]|nr:hypothetical protein [Gammaproteobacteria bacterium]